MKSKTFKQLQNDFEHFKSAIKSPKKLVLEQGDGRLGKVAAICEDKGGGTINSLTDYMTYNSLGVFMQGYWAKANNSF